jgi:RNA methyltransferase, TrmH family
MIITSLTNEKIKEYTKLQDKKYRDTTNKFLIEGEHLIEEASKYNLVEEIIVEENYSYKTTLPTIYVTSAILKKLSTLTNPPKVMALCHKKENSLTGTKYLLLADIQNPGNLGTIIRSAVAFNIDTIILSPKTVDLYNSKVLRATEGLLFALNIVVADLEPTIKDLKAQGITIYGTSVENGTDIKKITNYNNYALLIGNEGSGLSPNLKVLCDQMLYIKMNNKAESLNAAVATSIILYELGAKDE